MNDRHSPGDPAAALLNCLQPASVLRAPGAADSLPSSAGSVLSRPQFGHWSVKTIFNQEHPVAHTPFPLRTPRPPPTRTPLPGHGFPTAALANHQPLRLAKSATGLADPTDVWCWLLPFRVRGVPCSGGTGPVSLPSACRGLSQRLEATMSLGPFCQGWQRGRVALTVSSLLGKGFCYTDPRGHWARGDNPESPLHDLLLTPIREVPLPREVTHSQSQELDGDLSGGRYPAPLPVFPQSVP